MTSIREAEELVKKAERGEWSLECDGQVLELMQKVANKIETRSATTKTSIDKMMLNLDETKVKLSNLTRINSIKNTKFCENLIRADHLEVDPKSDEVPKEAVKLSPQIAIENGLKLMEHCFEKHRVNLDPSSSGSQTSTVYRPIDKYMNVLPHLIGSDKWKHQWHVGLIAEPNLNQIEPQERNKNENFTAETSNEQQRKSITSSLDRTSLMASQDSLAKSINSIDERVATNRDTFTDDDDIESTKSLIVPNTSRFFQEQIEHRKIVNLFDDEPPSLSQSPILGREPVNLFEDNISEDSVAVQPEPNEKFKEQKIHFQQPVDLFNDNEFDDFIKKIEERPENKKAEVATSVEVKKPAASKPLQGNIQHDLGKVIAGVKTVHSKKQEPIPQTSKTLVETEKKKPETKLRATNLFDDDDQDDYFNEIIKQKSANKAVQPAAKLSAPIPVKTKFTSLFDDEDEEDESFDDIFKKKSLPKQAAPQVVSVKPKSSLFDDDDEEPFAVPLKQDLSNKVNQKENSMKVPPAVKTSIPEIIPKKVNAEEVLKKPNAEPKKETEIIPEIVEKEDELEKPEEKFEYAFKADPQILEEESVRDIQEEYPKEEVEFIPEVRKEKPNEVPERSVEIFDESESSSTKQELQQESVDKVVEEAGSTMEDITLTLPEDTPPDVNKTFEDQIDNEWLDEPLPQTPERSLNATLPFLSDEPPEDDENAWTTEDNFDDSELFFSPSSNDYSSVPLFDEVPPEDDAFIIPSKLETNPVIFNQSKVPDIDVKTDQQRQEKTVSSDEPDRSVNVKDIKSKMDIFNRKSESTSSLPPVKKSLPGKLSTNLKINVGALMPGARPTREIIENLDDSSKENLAEPVSISVTNSQPESSGTNLLNNDFTKSRARIQTKRRPSTRRGRKSNYDKSSLEGEREEVEPENISEASISESVKTFSSSVFETPEPTSNVEPIEKVSRDEKKAVTTNKISVFYDDEDDTRILVEQRKQKEKEEKTSKKDTASLFEDDDDDDFFASSSFKKKLPKTASMKVAEAVKTVHYDESDGDLFVPKTNKNPQKLTSSSLKASASLFDDDGDDDLFASIANKKSNPIAKNISNVSKTTTTSSLKAVPLKSSSLFGDDDDDDDDLFNSKPKASSKSSTKFQPSLKKTQKTRTDAATKADDDPLKDLFNK